MAQTNLDDLKDIEKFIEAYPEYKIGRSSLKEVWRLAKVGIIVEDFFEPLGGTNIK